MKKRRFIIIEPDGDISRWLFSDLENRPNVDVLLKPVNLNNKILKFIRKIHFSYKLNSIINLPCKSIWDKFYTLSKYKFSDEYEYIIIIGNFAINQFDLNYLDRIRKSYNAKIALLFTDPVCSEHAIRAYETTKKFKYDFIFTFDPGDAKKYNFTYTGPLYSYKTVKSEKPVRDIYFVGVNKNRIGILRDIYKKLNTAGIKCDFYVADVDKNDIKDDGIIYNERCSYEEVVNRIQRYNAILDVVQEGQTGATFRYFEAICYNKKLVTNNNNVKYLPFYNPDNILIFDDVNEIDPDWLLKPAVDYGYSGEFSPVRLLEMIDEECNKKIE